MNRNSKRKAKLLAKSFHEQRKAGKPVIPPPRKARSLWRGAKGWRPALVAQGQQVKG